MSTIKANNNGKWKIFFIKSKGSGAKILGKYEEKTKPGIDKTMQKNAVADDNSVGGI